MSIYDINGNALCNDDYETITSFTNTTFYSEGYNNAFLASQGMCTDGTYLYTSAIRTNNLTSQSTTTLMRKINLSDASVELEYTGYNYEHANGLAYDSTNNRLFITAWDYANNYSTIYTADADTLEYASDFDVSTDLTSIVGSDNYVGVCTCAYDNDNDKLILLVRGDCVGFAVYNSDLELESFVRIVRPDSSASLQGMCYNDNLLYVCWNVGTTDLMTCYDYNGNLIYTVDVTFDYELEACAVVNDTWYFLFSDSSYLTQIIYACTISATSTVSKVDVVSKYNKGKTAFY